MLTPRQAQTQFGLILSAAVGLIALGLVWAYFFGEQINYWGGRAVSDHGLTGVAALSFHNINLWIFIALLVFVSIAAFGGGRG